MIQLHFCHRLRILAAGAMFLLGLCSILETEKAHGQDFGTPDTVYYLSPQFALEDCTPTVRAILPIYLFSDFPTQSYVATLKLLSAGEFDTAFGYLFTPCDEPHITYFRNDSARTLSLGVHCLDGGTVTPVQNVVMRFDLLASPGDTILIESLPGRIFLLGDGIFWWNPIGAELEAMFVVPSSFTVPNGDCDCSGLITISDVVFLINYIFAGGLSPYDLNAADPNADCGNTISDVVYLINYIFAGGPPPLAGCVRF